MLVLLELLDHVVNCRFKGSRVNLGQLLFIYLFLAPIFNLA